MRSDTISHHRHTALAFISALLLVGTPLHAENTHLSQAPVTEDTAKAKASDDSEGISTPRRIAGFGVLAFLIGWMIWRNNGNRQPQEEAVEEEMPPTQEDK